MSPKKDSGSLLPKKKYCNALSYAINVHGIERVPGQEFDDTDDQETKNLVQQKYLVIVGSATPTAQQPTELMPLTTEKEITD